MTAGRDAAPWGLRAATVATLAVFLVPILAGLLGTALPAFGYLPALGGESFVLEAWRALFATPGLGRSVAVTLASGIGSTLLALGLTVLLLAAGHGRRWLDFTRRGAVAVVAVPHLAVAFGLAFLLAPSGWLARLASPWLTGWTRPPDLATVQDPYGLALTFGLVLKETPFLLLVAHAALVRVDADRLLVAARTLGYGPVAAWVKVVLPRLYPLIRLPVYAVLAYALSTVDMALVLGPTSPPTLAPLVLRGFNDPDLAERFTAAAGACLLLGLTAASIGLWRLGERAVAVAGRRWLVAGGRGGDGRRTRAAAMTLAGALGVVALLGLAALLLASLAGSWRFPDALPTRWTGRAWSDAGDWLGPALATLGTGLAATLAALALALAWLEDERRRGRPPGGAGSLVLYLPLLVPQAAFLFGVQTLLAWARLDGTLPAVIGAQLLFVLPYVLLTLADPYRALDPRYLRTARGLGKGAWAAWARVTLPLLLRPILTAAALGFAVAAAQFLPTLTAGGGRVATLTTEALALAEGGGRRTVGVLAFVLAALPLAGFVLAAFLPTLLGRGERRA